MVLGCAYSSSIHSVEAPRNKPNRAPLENSQNGIPIRRMPDFIKPLVSWLMPRIGPKGLEFARARVEMKAIESVLHLRRNKPNQKQPNSLQKEENNLYEGQKSNLSSSLIDIQHVSEQGTSSSSGISSNPTNHSSTVPFKSRMAAA